MITRLPFQPCVYLDLARPDSVPTVRILQRHDAVGARRIETLHVEHVEQVEVHAQAQPLLQREELQQRCVRRPVERTQPVLLAPRVQPGIHRHLHRAAVLQLHIDVVGVVERSVGVRGLPIHGPRVDGVLCGMIIAGQSVHPVAHPVGVAAVDVAIRDVPVEVQVTRIATLVRRGLGGGRRVAAIQNRVLLVIHLKLREGPPIRGGQRIPGADQRTGAGKLPPADQVVQPTGRVAAHQLAPPEGQIVVPIPARAVLGDARVALQVQEAIQGGGIGGHRTGDEIIGRQPAAIAEGVAGQAVRVADRVEHLEA